MAPNEAYYRWINKGRPISGLARPLRVLKDRLRAYGYTVYDIGNEDHLKANPPLDHTPYATTSWPSLQAEEWWLAAIDIMPPPPGKGLPSLQQLGDQILRDKKAGVFYALKYMNWEPEGDYKGPCYQENFKPNYIRYNSSDRGHIHLSGRSDCFRDTNLDWYDPVARYWARVNPKPPPLPVPVPVPIEEDDKMLVLMYDDTAPTAEERAKVWLSDGMTKRYVGAADSAAVRALQGLSKGTNPVFKIFQGGEIMHMGDNLAFGVDVASLADTATVTNDQLNAMANKIAAVLVDSPTNGLTAAERADTAQIVAEELRSVVFKTSVANS